jgi:SAM-dependent methyltransferase
VFFFANTQSEHNVDYEHHCTSLFTRKLRVSAAPASTPALTLSWSYLDESHTARWLCERGDPPPRRLRLIDDTMTADVAYRLATNNTALLWQGDFNNARNLLQAMTRRADKATTKVAARAAGKKASAAQASSPATLFVEHRAAQQRRARALSQVLVQVNADYSIPLGRAPDVREACTHAWGAAQSDRQGIVVSLRELLGVMSAFEWRKRGVEMLALGPQPNNRIYPHYGVFSPVRGEYVELVAKAPLPVSTQLPYIAFDVGTGTGVLAGVLARRGLARIVATDQDPRAIACARENIGKLGVADRVNIIATPLFPQGKAALIVCNPPWLPATPSAPIERAVYDENSQMLLSFLNGLLAHLTPDGEGWLILSDLAEHLGLRSREWLLAAISTAGLKVAGRLDTAPTHPKVADATDPLHAARAAEVTSLWRLVKA